MRMREVLRAGTTGLGAALCVALMTGIGSAQCSLVQMMSKAPGVRNASWSTTARPRLVRAAYGMGADSDDGDGKNAMVGLWHFQFWAPDVGGTEVDAGYQVWHKDGTEIMNSGLRPPRSGDFCLGVWERTGERMYRLNHFTTSWDPAGNVLLGTGNIKEEITVSQDGKSYSGHFSIVQYDESLNVLGQVAGVVTGTRLDVNSPPTTVH